MEIAVAKMRVRLDSLIEGHCSLQDYVRGEMTHQLDEVIRKAISHNGELKRLEVAVSNWKEAYEEQRRLNDRLAQVVTRLEQQSEQSSSNWDRVISFILAVIQVLVTSGMLYVFAQMQGAP